MLNIIPNQKIKVSTKSNDYTFLLVKPAQAYPSSGKKPNIFKWFKIALFNAYEVTKDRAY